MLSVDGDTFPDDFVQKLSPDNNDFILLADGSDSNKLKK